MQQQSFNQTQGNFMQQPPNVISTKDSLYLTDMLSWNLLAFKKAHFYANQVQNMELKQAFEQCGQMHQRHYQQILSHLNNQSSSMIGLQQ